MALDSLQQKYEKYVPREQGFYANYYRYILIFLMFVIGLMIVIASVLLYQSTHQPLPSFHAVQPDKKEVALVPFEAPNLRPETILRWASKAAVTAYTFDLLRYREQIAAARPYFTEAGWQDYLRSVTPLLESVVSNQLFVYGIVAGTPVISNQGPLPGKGNAWRVQIPFLVTYRSANTVENRKFYVALTLVDVPTGINPQGIGIDQFIMSSRRG